MLGPTSIRRDELGSALPACQPQSPLQRIPTSRSLRRDARMVGAPGNRWSMGRPTGVPHPESRSGPERRHPGRNGSVVQVRAQPNPSSEGGSRCIADDIAALPPSCRLAAALTAYPRGCGRRFLGLAASP
jgi:hypothetical protein